MVSVTFLVGTIALVATTASAQLMSNATDIAPFPDVGGDDCFYYKDYDHPGFDIGNKPATDFRDCNNICIDFKGCVTWAWNNYNGGTCWLKSFMRNGKGEWSQGTTSLGCEVPTKEPNYVCSDYKNTDFVGNDIGNRRAYSWECCAICDKTAGCSAYAWNYDNGGTCYLKSGVGQVVYKAGVISSSTKLNLGPVCPFEYDTDFVGMDIGNKPAKDAGVCCSQCKENKDCKAYSWNNYQGGTCWMKSGKGVTSKTAGVISAALFPTRN